MISKYKLFGFLVASSMLLGTSINDICDKLGWDSENPNIFVAVSIVVAVVFIIISIRLLLKRMR